MDDRVSIINKTKSKLPNLPFSLLKGDILGKNYNLSVAYVSEKTSKELNKKYRGKNKSTNVLSFALSKTEGELIICPGVVKKEKKKFGKNFRELLGFLVIHGMLHLEGMEHGSIMERQEQKYDQKYFYRHRHRHDDNQSRGGRILQGRKKS